MPRAKRISNDEPRRIVPNLTVEGAEAQNIALAVDCARKQLQEGTASSQVITHYLKLATEQHKVEVETLKLKQELIQAQTSSLANTQNYAETAEKALREFRRYSGNNVMPDDEDYVIYE